MAKIPTSKFLKVYCPRCRVPQILFGKSSLRIRCRRCNWLLTEPSGGKARIRAPVKEVIMQ